MAERVTIYEVSPRDGLQNEPRLIGTADKIRLVDLLSACGFSHIEVTSFVSPRRVPQMADAAQVLAGIRRTPGTTYAALTPNQQGFQHAMKARAGEVAVFASASEGFSQKNINCSIAESIERFRPVLAAARTAGIPVRGYVSCVTDCPCNGPVAPEAVARVAQALLDLGCHQISLGDTLGAGTPETIGRMLETVLERIPAARLAGHYHDTRGRALDNIRISLARGLRVFDSSAGGLGGCPFAPGARGNVATETVVAMLHRMGFATGIDPARLQEAADFALSLRSRQ
ncbi:hydroxymethylglutaryl-CoA lyase [Pseudogemmobacter humi]|uniref:Hydroxymethylglutaryl-CoA lyase YngG n=1 Tax=Pseudogemmobacter humi TaxID=2483812 RepID=A0A3P5XBD1_9RHOB|nr:hydroxymethylglutaryl-CoA lyase [Pseudogemmobacter humi]VDC27515.1 Hydroxymethylglutaryl-CoA lyase YngG [Pseudogemmobacter humi]